MNSFLDILSSRELQLMQKVNSFQGRMEEIDRLIPESGIPIEYNNIFEDYSLVNKDVEALKRAIFIQWYAVSEPMTYTGVLNLEENIQKENLLALTELIRNKEIDVEFQTMLLHYYKISDWYFDSYFNFEELINLILRFDNRHSYLDIECMENRGQMGKYWNSINS